MDYKPSGNDILNKYMKKYADEYVLVQDFDSSKERIIEHNKDLKTILKIAEKYPEDEVIIDYIPQSGTIYF